MAPAWDRDPAGSDQQIAANVQGLLVQIAADALARRAPTLRVADRWHREVYASVAVPSASYLGNPRDSAPLHPDLIGYEVRVGSKQGLPAARVTDALRAFVAQLRAAIRTFDTVLPIGQPPSTGEDLRAVMELAAVTHGEWVRIHPYANGNGRVARLWANWVAVRYGLPPFVAVKPRPGGVLYEAAARSSMGTPPLFTGDHNAMTAVFVDMLHQKLTP